MTFNRRPWRRALLGSTSSLVAGVMISSMVLAQQTVLRPAVAAAKPDGPAKVDATPTSAPVSSASKSTSAGSDSTTVGSAASMEQMAATIRRLEERVKELETKLDKSAPVSAEIAVAAKAVKTDGANGDDAAKPEAVKSKEQKAE